MPTVQAELYKVNRYACLWQNRRACSVRAMTKSPTSLADRLVLARQEIGLQQDQVAKEAGISQQSYSALETGKSKATVKIGSLARVLGVDAYWLETGEGTAKPSRVGESSPPYMPPDRRLLLEWFDELGDLKRRAFIALIAKE